MIVSSFGQVQALTQQTTGMSGLSPSLALYDRHTAYGDVYRDQPNIRIPVDFVGRNIAHLAPQVFRRISDTDRVRLATHQLAVWLGHPNPGMSGYRLMETLMGDFGVYGEAFWLKVRYVDGADKKQIGLLPLPPCEMAVDGVLMPKQFVWTLDGRPRSFPPSEIVYFNCYNPVERLRGLSVIQTMRRVVSEDAAAGEHREAYWRNASRHDGVIEVDSDKGAGKWQKPQWQDWRDQWQARFAGAGAGQIAVLPPGTKFQAASFSPKDSEYTQGGKLRREITTAGYHVPQPMVGILDHATFSNVREQHKHLYQDTLGPTLEMIEQELVRQLLIECDDRKDVYVEFNIAAKLAGTFEERATAIQVSVGRPWRTVNEARALENLPRIDDPEMDRVAPQQGGPSDATANPSGGASGSQGTADSATPSDRQLIAPVVEATRTRQQARLAKVPPFERASAFFADVDRWNRELAADLAPIVGPEAAEQIALETNLNTFTALNALEAV